MELLLTSFPLSLKRVMFLDSPVCVKDQKGAVCCSPELCAWLGVSPWWVVSVPVPVAIVLPLIAC